MGVEHGDGGFGLEVDILGVKVIEITGSTESERSLASFVRTRGWSLWRRVEPKSLRL